MPRKIIHSPFFYPFLLVLICLFIAYRNYTPDTFLTGWDTLHPEFNFPHNFQRLLFGVWRPDQGFGAIAGHSHMADLPRVAILWLLHFIFPLSFLRYSYIFLCLIIGPLGLYFLIRHLFKSPLIAFLSSLAYLLNLNTVQQFYVPFEMFPTQWAYLPWIILFSLKHLSPTTVRTGRDLSLIFFTIFTILSTPQAYAAHLWYPFFGAYCLFILIRFILVRTGRDLSFRLIAITLLINSFWLLPNIYYLATSSSTPKENQQNRLHSQEFLLKNRQTGTLSDSTLSRGFYLDWNIYNFSTQQFQQLMPQWRNHFDNYDIKLIGYSFFIFSLIGLIIAWTKRDPVIIPFTPFFLIPFILLSNRVFPFNLLFDLLLKVPLLQEILRFIFTKVSGLMIFGQVIFFAYFLHHLARHLSRRFIALTTVSAFVIYAFPVFQGYLISPQVRTNIPSSYFNLWQFMDQQPDGRILALPLHDPAGWIYTSWGYQGSGLIWFGLPQSITDRDNDRWSSYNEEAYRELRTALYSNNPDNLSSYLNKYHFSYLLWDKNITTASPKNQSQSTYSYETFSLLNHLQNSGFISQFATFDNLFVYRLSQPPPAVSIITNPPSINPTYHWHYTDTTYQNQDYITSDNPNTSYYPFRNILTHTNRIDTTKLPLSPTPLGWKMTLLTPDNIDLFLPPVTIEPFVFTSVHLREFQF